MPPVNDNLADALVITVGTNSGTTVGSTTEGTENADWFDDNVHTVWYKWTNSSGVSAKVTFNNPTAAGFIGGVEFDLWLLTGTPATFLDVTGGSWPGNYKMSFGYYGSPWFDYSYPDGSFYVQPNKSIYLVAFDGDWALDEGTFSFDFAVAYTNYWSISSTGITYSDSLNLVTTGTHPPANDNVVDAEAIASGTIAGSTVRATLEAGQGTKYGPNVWYKWHNSTGQDAFITLENLVGDAGYDSVGGPEIDVWTFTGTPANYTNLNTNGTYYHGIGNSFHDTSIIYVGVVSGDTLYLSVGNWSWDTIAVGTFTFDFSHASLPSGSPNDDFADAIELTSNETIVGDTRSATSEAGYEYSYWGDHNVPTVWFYYHNTYTYPVLVGVDNFYVLTGFPSRAEIIFWMYPYPSTFTPPVTPPTGMEDLDTIGTYYDSMRSPSFGGANQIPLKPDQYLYLTVLGRDEWDGKGVFIFDWQLNNTPTPLISMKHGAAH